MKQQISLTEEEIQKYQNRGILLELDSVFRTWHWSYFLLWGKHVLFVSEMPLMEPKKSRSGKYGLSGKTARKWDKNFNIISAKRFIFYLGTGR